jgi:hypothetical protein
MFDQSVTGRARRTLGAEKHQKGKLPPLDRWVLEWSTVARKRETAERD